MKIEISIEVDGNFEHDSYHNSIDDAINRLYALKIEKAHNTIPINPQCGKCVYNYWECGLNAYKSPCPAYRRDPPAAA